MYVLTQVVKENVQVLSSTFQNTTHNATDYFLRLERGINIYIFFYVCFYIVDYRCKDVLML